MLNKRFSPTFIPPQYRNKVEKVGNVKEKYKRLVNELLKKNSNSYLLFADEKDTHIPTKEDEIVKFDGIEKKDELPIKTTQKENIGSDYVDTSKKIIEKTNYYFPPLTLLPDPVFEKNSKIDNWVLNQVETLNRAFKDFKVDANVKTWTIGPSVVQIEVSLGKGVKVSKITSLADDLKLALAVKNIRIEAPIPGKSTVGIEIPNRYERTVRVSEVLKSSTFKQASSKLTVALGVDLFGTPRVIDIQKCPHILIAGATGAGKSVFLNSLLVSLLYKASPKDVRLLLIDPKSVEMAPYQGIAHLIAPIISDTKNASLALKWIVKEMERRYHKFSESKVRNIESYNKKVEFKSKEKLPYIVIVIDELADLMLDESSDVSEHIAKIAAKARAAGIHLIVATQRPSVDVITGTIKNNIPSRIAFMVASQVDSRTILDSAGAEKLLGKGDMLYLGSGLNQPIRIQGAYIDEEIDAITDFVRTQGGTDYLFTPQSLEKSELINEKDNLFMRVLDYIANEKTISTSKIQRVFSVGYNRAAGIIDKLENKNYISKAYGSKARKVFLTQEKLNEIRQQEGI